MDLAPYNSAALAGWGIDQRDPTADVRLIEYCLRVPTSEYLQNGVPRSLARRALLDRLPQAIIDEPRRGYQGADWHVRLGAIRTELQAKIERLAPGAGTSEVVDCDALLSVLNEWPEGGEWNSAARIRLYREAFLRAVSAVLFVTKVTKVTKVTRVLRGEPSY